MKENTTRCFVISDNNGKPRMGAYIAPGSNDVDLVKYCEDGRAPYIMGADAEGITSLISDLTELRAIIDKRYPPALRVTQPPHIEPVFKIGTEDITVSADAMKAYAALSADVRKNFIENLMRINDKIENPSSTPEPDEVPPMPTATLEPDTQLYEAGIVDMGDEKVIVNEKGITVIDDTGSAFMHLGPETRLSVVRELLRVDAKEDTGPTGVKVQTGVQEVGFESYGDQVVLGIRGTFDKQPVGHKIETAALTPDQARILAFGLLRLPGVL